MLDNLNFCELNNFELWLVMRIYFVASVPIILMLYSLWTRKISLSVLYTLICTFIIAGLGWEIWLTYGLAGGLPVDERRSAMLTCAIPVDLNWFLNSLADVTVVWIGLLLARFIYRGKQSPFLEWKWPAFFILLIWFLLQNIYVEAFIYHMQLGSNGDLSWAPMSPFGSWFNPTLFEIVGRPITLQAQICWILVTPIIYALSIFFYNRYKK